MMDGLAMIPTLVDAVKVGPGDDFFPFFWFVSFLREEYNSGFTGVNRMAFHLVVAGAETLLRGRRLRG